jgi:hypothetical protein
MAAIVHMQGLLGETDGSMLGKTKAISAAKRAIMHIAQGSEIKGKTPRADGLALRTLLHMYLKVRRHIVQVCITWTMLFRGMFGKVRDQCTCTGAPRAWMRHNRHQGQALRGTRS